MSYTNIYICITDCIHICISPLAIKGWDMYPLVGFCMFLIVFVSSQSSTKSGVEAHGQIFRSTFRSSSKLITYRTYQNCVGFRQQTSCQHMSTYVNHVAWHVGISGWKLHICHPERDPGVAKRSAPEKRRRGEFFLPFLDLSNLLVSPLFSTFQSFLCCGLVWMPFWRLGFLL